MKDNQTGRSMIEMLGVIAIIGVLTVGGIAGYSKAMEQWRINKTANQISYIVAHLRSLYASQMDYHGLNSTSSPRVLDKTQSFPQEMKDEGKVGSYHNPFQGKVTVVAGGRDNVVVVNQESGERSGYNDNMAFILTYAGIPRAACIGLATIDWGTGTNGGLIAMSINSSLDEVSTSSCKKMSTPQTSEALGSMVICEGNGVMSPADASIGCSSESNNTLRFKFY